MLYRQSRNQNDLVLVDYMIDVSHKCDCSQVEMQCSTVMTRDFHYSLEPLQCVDRTHVHDYLVLNTRAAAGYRCLIKPRSCDKRSQRIHVEPPSTVFSVEAGNECLASK